MMRNIIISITFLVTQACSPLGPLATVPHAPGNFVTGAIPGVAQIEMLTVMGTERTIMDHVISLSSRKNCSAGNLEKGQYYCAEDEPGINQKIFCYNTLGRVTCYSRPDPYNGGYQKVGSNQHNMINPPPVNRP